MGCLFSNSNSESKVCTNDSILMIEKHIRDVNFLNQVTSAHLVQDMSQSRKLLIAMDGQKHSDYAFDWYLRYFYKPKDEVVLFHCIEPDVAAYLKGIKAAANSGATSAGDEEENPVVAKLQSKATASGLKVSVLKALSSKPGEAIIKAGEEQRVDMIITGSRSLGTVRRTLEGSVSEYVVHQSSVPVLVVKT
ncbi:universal stress protein SAS1637 isoform X2 [Biomphalaria pfeifferi]|uniref:Universal stress protein SAS1637 isoform X2 n=1 Tax=Biomphalaria pfeifferi TaxID=112525 RepID=A0AAD8F710_BIOPF|nr:universal stress protein SAS1637 isoform X2 [Biomphalaria pfeifferi]